ncbi:MAG: hypothetical protein ACI9UK_002255, partial [Candidatus Krumholzibacteriia bacterium]
NALKNVCGGIFTGDEFPSGPANAGCRTTKIFARLARR